MGVIPDIVLPSVRDALEVGEQYADHALAHDKIKRARDFQPFKRENLFLAMLEEKSQVRVKASKDFAYVVEDTERLEERMKKNQTSLNIETRKKEIAEADARRKERNAERLERFKALEAKDKESFKVYRLTLDDVNLETLPEVDLEEDAERHMRQAKDEVADLDDTPLWPSGLDATKREGLSILRDLVSAVEAGKVAGVLKRDE